MVSVRGAKQPSAKSCPSFTPIVIGILTIGVIVLLLARDNGDCYYTNLLTTSSTSIIDDNDNNVAYHESFGFFTDVPNHEWLLRKRISQAVQHNYQSPRAKDFPDRGPSWWHQLNWNPDFSCAAEVAIGGNDDGKKFVCDPHRILKQKDCLVYSIGSDGNFDFELGINAALPHCEIHIFDPGNYEYVMNAMGVKNAVYHKVGLKSSYEFNMTTVREASGKQFQDSKMIHPDDLVSLPDLVQKLGHKGRQVDLFKIDCEGCEWRSYKDWFSLDLRQILVEVHNRPLIANDFFWELHNHGYVITHKEPNIQWSGGNCVEFSFLKLHPDFFKESK